MCGARADPRPARREACLAAPLLLLPLLLGALGGPATAQPTVREDDGGSSPFALRILEAPLPPDDARIRPHVELGLELGFNAVWLSAARAGRWAPGDAPNGAGLRPEFLDLVRWCRARGLRVFLEVAPLADVGGTFVFSGSHQTRRLLRFCRLVERRTGIRDFVLSFEHAPLRHREIDDILAYGRPTAAAHLELARRLDRALGRRDRVWLLPAVSSDEGLDASERRYPSELLRGLAQLPARVGIVWSGPLPASPSITADDLARARARLGGRPLLLADRYPANGSGPRIPLALVLGPLRGREPGIATKIEGYLARPMAELGGSRLALLTVADFLRDPAAYDPDASWQRAIERLAGDDRGALDALRTQALEWGGWIGERNYHTAANDNPFTAARQLPDPAAVASWTWTVKTYPERMRVLGRLRDEAFREDLLSAMARRLAVARAVALVRELLARRAAGRDDTAALLEQLRAERARVEDRPEVLAALDRFLWHAGAFRRRAPGGHAGPG